MHSSRVPLRVGIGHIVVIGGGSVGSLFSGRLATLKDLADRVWLLTRWSDHAQAIMGTKGVIVQEDASMGGACLVGGVKVVGAPSEVLKACQYDDEAVKGRVNVVILAAKQPQIRRAAEDAAALLGSSHGGLLISLLNGVGHMDILRKAFKYHDVSAAMIHGVFHGGAAIECPGVVRHTGAGVTHLGLPKERMDLISEGLLADVASALNRCGLPAEVKADTDAAVWEKLVVNAAVNPLTAILGCKNGFLVESEACRQIMQDAAREAHQVGSLVVAESLGQEPASQTSLVSGGWSACAQRAISVALATAQNTSMLSDLQRGQTTEIEAISGAVVREGERLGVATPVNRTLACLVRAMEQANAERNRSHDEDE